MKTIISYEERKVANKLKAAFLNKNSHLPYVNLDESHNYMGWVTNFGLTLPNGELMRLDLNVENDLFLLFILALGWSRTGPWENAAFFVTYLRSKKLDHTSFWLNEDNCESECKNRVRASVYSKENISGFATRKKLSFRKDLYKSITVLASQWNNVLEALKKSEIQKDFTIFMKYIRSIKGLGVGNRRILIKIPLILRELRCQNKFHHISGEYCCVPDARVYKACKEMGIRLPISNSLDTLIKSSAKIYHLFGNLYDLPLFAYYDLKDNIKMQDSINTI